MSQETFFISLPGIERVPVLKLKAPVRFPISITAEVKDLLEGLGYEVKVHQAEEIERRPNGLLYFKEDETDDTLTEPEVPTEDDEEELVVHTEEELNAMGDEELISYFGELITVEGVETPNTEEEFAELDQEGKVAAILEVLTSLGV